jgi:hypothetical protein
MELPSGYKDGVNIRFCDYTLNQYQVHRRKLRGAEKRLQ